MPLARQKRFFFFFTLRVHIVYPRGFTRVASKKRLERSINERTRKVLGSGFPPASCSAAMRLVQGWCKAVILALT